MSEDQKNQLATTEMQAMYAIPTDSPEEAKELATLSKVGDWLPRFQLCSATSDLCKKRKVPTDNYAIIKGKDDVLVIGESAEVMVFGWRPCAVDLRGDRPKSYYDRNDAKFQEIEKLSAVKDSNCVYGPELLVYVPKVQKFATFHFNSKTLRRIVDQMFDTEFVNGKSQNKYPSARLLRSKLIETADYSWQAPVITELVTPITQLPASEVVTEQLRKFKNPPKEEVGEKVEAAPAETGRTR